jgi:hypothetical protein
LAKSGTGDIAPATALTGVIDKIHAAKAAKAKGCSFTQHDWEALNQLGPVYHGECQGSQELSSALTGGKKLKDLALRNATLRDARHLLR